MLNFTFELEAGEKLNRGLFKGGWRRGGVFHTLGRGTMVVRDGAVTPEPSRECDITFFVRSEKLQNESFPNFLNFGPQFCPEFCSEFSPNFLRTFCALFHWGRRPEKLHQKSPPFFNANFPGKHEKNIHKILLKGRQTNSLLRDDQNLRATIAWQHSGGAQGAERHRAVIAGVTRMSFPRSRSSPPILKNARLKEDFGYVHETQDLENPKLFKWGG